MRSTVTPILEAHGLTKRFGRTQALAGLDLVAHPGRVVALLGPNGAGKTTFVRTVATLLRPDAGSLRVAGIDALRHPARVRQVIGLAGQFAAVEPAMTGRENLEMVARLFGLKPNQARAAATAVLEQIQLSEDADRLVRTYSGGMRRRLDLGASLAGAPRLLLLDEPTAGLDPGSRVQLWDAIRQLVAAGTDVLLTTQYLDEADQLAADIVIIDHGKVIAAGTPAELKTLAGDDVIEVHVRDAEALSGVAMVLSTVGRDPRVDLATHRVSVAVDDGTRRLMDAMRALDHGGVAIEDISLRRPTLDEVFLTLTGRSADTADQSTGPEAA
jgi:ABC-2 type transport system ATP-binding protein